MILRGVELVGEDTPAREVVLSPGPAIAFDGAIAFPGLVNSHDHLEFNLYPALGHERYPDYVAWSLDIQRRDAGVIASHERVPRRVRLRWGALKNLLCGVTAVAHHGDGDDLRGLAVDTARGTSIHSLRFEKRWRWRLLAPPGREPYVFHVGEGTSAAARREIGALLRWNVLRRPVVAVHALGMRRDQASRFRAVVWCPLSNEFLYGATADVASLKRATAVLFGTDSTLTGSWNLWDHLRRARALGGLDDRELFSALTDSAARVWGLAQGAGPGSGTAASWVVARKKDASRWDAFFAIEPEDILLVVRGGRVALSDAALGLAPPPGAYARLRVGTREKVVAEDVGALVAAIRACGVEPNLPFSTIGATGDGSSGRGVR
jgi:cytosine/adenosine deaminase-related metal-dependent hydrolase